MLNTSILTAECSYSLTRCSINSVNFAVVWIEMDDNPYMHMDELNICIHDRLPVQLVRIIGLYIHICILIRGVFFSTNSVLGSLLFFGICILISHSSENCTFGRLEICDLLANFLLFWLRSQWSSNSNVANDFTCQLHPIKPVLLQDSQILRFHILLNSETLFFKAYVPFSVSKV